MGYTEQKKREFEASFRENGMMSDTDTIVDSTKGDLWENLSQIRGTYFFTQERLIFIGGLMGSSNFSAPYNKITELKLCNVGALIRLLPTGIRVVYTDENGKTAKKRLSVMKRKNWLAFLCEKTGIAAN